MKYKFTSFFDIFDVSFVILLECLKSIFNFFIQFIKPNYKSLENEVVLITGAASGIGRLLCVKFANQGSIVIGVDVDRNGLNVTKELVAKYTGKYIETNFCDVRCKANIINLRKQLELMDLHVDILVNNAGIVHGKRILELTAEEIKETFSVNVFSNFYTVQEFLPWMLLNDHGHIVFVSSIASSANGDRLSDYCASKASSIALSETLRIELMHAYRTRAINVTVVTPFFIKTNLFKGCKSRFPWLLPDLEPDYVAEKIVKGVMKNQQHLAIGRMMYLIPIIKALLPVNAQIELTRYGGGVGFLDNFDNVKYEDRQKFYRSPDDS